MKSLKIICSKCKKLENIYGKLLTPDNVFVLSCYDCGRILLFDENTPIYTKILLKFMDRNMVCKNNIWYRLETLSPTDYDAMKTLSHSFNKIKQQGSRTNSFFDDFLKRHNLRAEEIVKEKKSMNEWLMT